MCTCNVGIYQNHMLIWCCYQNHMLIWCCCGYTCTLIQYTLQHGCDPICNNHFKINFKSFPFFNWLLCSHLLLKFNYYYYRYCTLAPNINSGHLYQRVTTTGVYRFNGDPYSRASPKSATCAQNNP